MNHILYCVDGAHWRERPWTALERFAAQWFGWCP